MPKHSGTSLQLYVIIILMALGFTACKTEAPQPPPISSAFPHKNNVFASVDTWYSNPVWREQALSHGGEAIAHHSTAIWLDGLGEVENIPANSIPNIIEVEDGVAPRDGLGLRDHLIQAEQQGNALVQLVLYSAPGRDCNANVSTGRLPATDYGFQVYVEHYINPIEKIIRDYPHIPIAMIVEPFTLTTLVKHRDKSSCQEVSNDHAWGYTNTIRHAINTLSELPNVHLYLDINASNELGWESDIQFTTRFFHGVLNGFSDELHLEAKALGILTESQDGATGLYQNIEVAFVEPPFTEYGNTQPPGYSKIDGFASNISNYVPLTEPYLGDPHKPAGAEPLRSHYFYAWNPRFDELSYTEDWLTELKSLNAQKTEHLGVIIDTSRNGWGQAHKRLAGAEITQNPDEVNEFRIDQREHRQNWCNQPSGLGKRPQKAPPAFDWLDAYVWVKNPGYSDGIFSPDFPISIFDFNRRYENMCVPDELSTPGQKEEITENLNLSTGAMDNAPHRTRWFAEGFSVYLENAWPPLCEGHHDRCQ